MAAAVDTGKLTNHLNFLSLNQRWNDSTTEPSPGQLPTSADVSPQPALLETEPPLLETEPPPFFERHGNLWSQYHTFDAVTIAPLEKAILYCRVRAFDQARAILNAFPPELRNHPVIAYERCQTYWLEWRLKTCLNVLQEAIAWAEARGKTDDASGMYTLLRVSLAETEVLVDGDFSKARDSLKEIRRWLLKTPIDEYTDVQVQCIFQYYFVLQMANVATDNFDESHFLSIPHVSKDSVDSPISQLREHLQRNGRLRDACALLNVELNLRPDEGTGLRACGALLEACALRPASEPVWYIEGRTRLLLAQKLRSNGQVSESKLEFQLANESLQKARLPAELNNCGLSITLGELSDPNNLDPGMQLKLWEMFSEQPAVQNDGFMMSTALKKATEAALEVLTTTPSQNNRKIFWRWQNRYEALLEELGNTFYLYLGHSVTADSAAQLFEDYGIILKWHKVFDETHPNFNIWGLRLMGKRRVQFIFLVLKDADAVEKLAREMYEITRQRDQFWKEDGYNVQTVAEIAAQLDAEDGGISGETKVSNHWFSEWLDEIALTTGRVVESHLQLSSNNAIRSRPVLNTLVRWLKTASVNGELDKEELVCILVPAPGAAETFDVEMLLSNLTPESLHVVLFGTEASPTSNSRWEDVFTILSEWLRNRVTYNETKRHTLLYRLQREMLRTVVEMEDIMIQAQRLVNLGPTLCEQTQHFTKSNVRQFRNTIASAKNMIYEKRQGEPLSDDADPKFKEVVALYQLSLEEAVKAGDTLAEATTALYIAQLYFWGAKTLKKESMLHEFFKNLDQSNIAFEKGREGWKVLSGWDKVYKLLKAVSEELRLQIVPLAVVVLCQIPANAGEKRDTSIWSMIQMGKSIGLGWLMRTNSLDQSVLPCKNDNLPFTEYKEVPIVKPEDLSMITSDAGGDVVYVDWYRATGPQALPKPFVVIVLPNKPPLVTLADITWDEVDRIIDKFLLMDEEDLGDAHARKLLRKLNPLVKPLAKHTTPGQVLVFSSIEKLHQVPLHALLVNKQILIKRNPIVYCSSLTVLDVLFKSRKARYQKDHSSPNTMSSSSAAMLPRAALFGDSPSDEGQQALLDLSRQLSVKAHTVADNNFTTSALQSTINTPGLDLFHYHGHASFEKNKPLDQGLEFDDRRYTLREVFDLSAQSSAESERGGYHATLLGCSSGMSTTRVSSDVVGLVPAFLYAGATSTVSGLWRIDDKDAAIYSKTFYEESFLKRAVSGEEKVTVEVADKEEDKADRGEQRALEDTSQFDTPVRPAKLESDGDQDSRNKSSNPLMAPEPKGAPSHDTAGPYPASLPNNPSSVANDNRINLAVAHQRAVLAIMEKRPKLVHWAPFVLNGYWMR